MYHEQEYEDAKLVSSISGFVSGVVTTLGLILITSVVMVNQFPLEWAKITWWLFKLG